MPFPKTEQELKEAGYRYEGKSYCRACGAQMAWYNTPKGKHIPLNADNLEPHFALCPKRNEFRKQ